MKRPSPQVGDWVCWHLTPEEYGHGHFNPNFRRHAIVQKILARGQLSVRNSGTTMRVAPSRVTIRPWPVVGDRLLWPGGRSGIVASTDREKGEITINDRGWPSEGPYSGMNYTPPFTFTIQLEILGDVENFGPGDLNHIPRYSVNRRPAVGDRVRIVGKGNDFARLLIEGDRSPKDEREKTTGKVGVIEEIAPHRDYPVRVRLERQKKARWAFRYDGFGLQLENPRP